MNPSSLTQFVLAPKQIELVAKNFTRVKAFTNVTFLACLTSFTRSLILPVLLVAPGCTWFYPFEPGCTHLYPMVLGCTRLYLVLPSCTHLYTVVHGCTRLYLVVTGFTRLYLVVTCFARLYPNVPG